MRREAFVDGKMVTSMQIKKEATVVMMTSIQSIKIDPWPYQEVKPLEANVTTGGDTSKFQNWHSQNARTVMH